MYRNIAEDVFEQPQFARSIDAPGRLVQPHNVRTSSLFALSLLNATRSDVVEALTDAAVDGARLTISFINAHCINVARRDADYAAALRQSDLLLPDGSGIRIAALLAGARLGDNLNGTDLFPDLCASAVRHHCAIFLLGGLPGVAAAAADTMRAANPGLCVAGTADGYFDDRDTDALIDRINASGAAMLFVGFGVPRQELWIARHRDRLRVPVVFGVGGLFDYYSGRIPRAPKSLRRIGCEWVWRLAQEPRRMARRYLVGNAQFLAHATAHAATVHDVTTAASHGVKRALDLVAATSAAIVAAPVLAAVAAAIKLEDGGPVFFRQTRIGDDGKPFTMLKFRSMAVDAEARRAALLAQSERDGVCFKMRRDPRITRVGAIIRRFSLDELPQIFNVLGGSMSLVGPRPALPEEVVTYCDRSRGRLRGKPGITCIWQVSGRAEIPFERQVEMDIDYLSRRSLWLDLGLLVRTVPAAIGGRGAY